jgi:hypothetical protein
MHNFGKIKHNICEVAAAGISDKDPKKVQVMKKFFKVIKENKILRAEAKIYKNLETMCNENESIAMEYIKENIALISKFGLDALKKEHRKLEVLLEGYDLIEDYNHKELHENIHKLITTKKNFNNVHGIVESMNVVKEHILNNKPAGDVINEDYLPTSVLTRMLTEKINDKYKDLSETEKKVAKVLVEGNKEAKENVFAELKSEALTKLNTVLQENKSDLDMRAKILDVKERLLEMSYNENEFASDAMKVINLKNILN